MFLPFPTKFPGVSLDAYCAMIWQLYNISLHYKIRCPMKQQMKNNERTILSSMEEVVNLAKKYSLSPEFYQMAEDCLAHISDVLSLSQDEALLLSLFFEKSASNCIWISSIADMINVSNIRIISMISVADSLIEKGFIKGSYGKEEKHYSVPMYVVDSIRQGVPFVPKVNVDLSIEDFFDRLSELFEDEEVPLWRREEDLEALINGNQHLPYCKVMRSYGLEGMEYVLANLFAHRLINEDDDMIGTHDWEGFMDSRIIVRRILNSLKEGTSHLIRKGILEPKNNDGIRDANFYHLTDKAKEMLFPDMDIVEKVVVTDKSLIASSSFAKKQLFYAPHIQLQIDRLAELLQPDNFRQVTERLRENGMRQGFAALFHGLPGTGKTETVNQLARMTGRDVMMVDVTRIKSCWVGESEQNIKAIFERYRNYVREKEVAPILLFNEADAVLGIRQEGAQRAVDKMENSIQNIILQEMENLEGIMIATTNLTCNLDSAFERRFIYKIEFERPTLEAKQQIWKSMIPSLSDAMTYSLAKDYDLSGGQIENIARKRTVEFILSGNEPSEEMIREYCVGETMSSRQEKRTRIGF